MRPGFFRRYLTAVGLILAVVVGVGVLTKPPPDRLRDGVEEALTAYAQTRQEAGQPAPEVVHRRANDWIIAVSHEARAGGELFYCIGGFFITFCSSPD